MSSFEARVTSGSPAPEPGALEILDEAVSLLRRAPLSIGSIYLLGALPFCLGFVYFCSDMAQSAHAGARLPGEALGLTILYFWMKTCQAVFSRQLLALLDGEDRERWTAARWFRTALLQLIYSGSLVIVYPLALVLTLPFGWTNAFYHSISIVATSSTSTLTSSFNEAGKLAALWPKQNHLILGMLMIAFVLLFLNLAVFCIMVPQLLDSLFGVETVFEENLNAWNNSSFYLNIFVLCFLLLNPLNKAVFVLRCFYGRARLSGADLRAELRRQHLVTAAAKPLRVAALVLLVILSMDVARAQSAPPASSTPARVQPADDLDRAIQKTLQKDEFSWRMSREEGTSQEEEGSFEKFVQRLLKYLKEAVRIPLKLLGDFFKWLFKNPHDPNSAVPSSSTVTVPWRGLLLLMAAILVGILVFLIFRLFRQRDNAPVSTVLKQIEIRTVDLEAENIQADELPEDSWLALAQQLIARGELRLALRAFYLASLSSLARQQFVRLAASKSNRDYLGELTRRLRGEISIIPLFRENMRLFEASWYGTHAVTVATIEIMRKNQQGMQGHAAE